VFLPICTTPSAVLSASLNPVAILQCTSDSLSQMNAFTQTQKGFCWGFVRVLTNKVPSSCCCDGVDVVFLVLQTQDPQSLEQLSKNVTRSGQTNVTLNYLRVSIDSKPDPTERSVRHLGSCQNNWVSIILRYILAHVHHP